MVRWFTSAQIRRCRSIKSPRPPLCERGAEGGFRKGGEGGFPAEETDCVTHLGTHGSCDSDSFTNAGSFSPSACGRLRSAAGPLVAAHGIVPSDLIGREQGAGRQVRAQADEPELRAELADAAQDFALAAVRRFGTQGCAAAAPWHFLIWAGLHWLGLPFNSFGF